MFPLSKYYKESKIGRKVSPFLPKVSAIDRNLIICYIILVL